MSASESENVAKLTNNPAAGRSDEVLLAELDALRERLGELEDLEVQRLSEEQERFDSLNVLDEYAQQLEESRDKLARLLKAGVAIEEASQTHEILQTVADAVGAAGWASAVVYLFNNFEVIESAYFGVCDEDIVELERNRRPAEERARMFSPDYDEFKISKSYLVPAERLHEFIKTQYVVPGRREVMPGDDWNPMDLVYVPMYSSTGKVLGTINCDDPTNGKRPTQDVFQYIEIFADLAARKIETVRLLNRQNEIEAQLRVSEERYRTIFDRSADSFFLMDDLFRECNRASLRLFGCDEDDIIGHSPAEFSPKFQPDGQRSDKLASEYINRARHGSPQNFEWMHLRKDGTELNCEVSLAAIDVNGKPMIMAIVRDISERRRAAHDKETSAIASQLFLSSRTLELVYSQLPKILVSRFNVSAAAIEIYDPSTDEMIIAGEEGTGLSTGFRLPVSMSISGTVARTGEAVIDTQASRRPDYAHAELRRMGLQTILCVPLRVRDQLIGVVWLADQRVIANIAQSLVPLQIVANYLAQAIDRYRAEEEMADLKQFFESLLDNLPAQVCMYDRSGNYRYANNASADDDWVGEWMIGRNDEEYCQRRGLPEELGRRRMSAVAEVVETSQLVTFEEVIRDSHDREHYFLRVMSPVADAAGHVDHVIGYGLDITDTKLWEQEQRLLKQLPTENPFPVLSCSHDGKIMYMNAAAETLAHTEANADVHVLLPEDHAQVIAEVFASQQSNIRRTTVLNGTTMLWTYALSNSGQVHMYGLPLSDLHQPGRKSDSTGGRAGADYAEALSVIAWTIDSNGNELWKSKAAEDLCASYGVTSVRDLIEQKLWERFQNLKERDQAISEETQHETRAWRWSARRVSQNRQLIELEDVTEVRDLQNKLRHAQRLESIGRLAGGIAHDFNNLLTGIIGNLDLIEQGKATEDQGRICVRDAAKAAERASTLVRQLLNYSRKSSGEQRVIDPNGVCESVLRMLQRTVERRIQIRGEFSANSWRISADPNQIEQILMNLGVNAADAVHDKFDGRQVFAEQPEILLRTINVQNHSYTNAEGQRGVGDFVAISVTDNGSGMTAQIRSRIFDAFFTTKSVHRGTGLGLAIVAELVDSLGGEIDVQSEVGRGTTFTVYLPRAAQMASEEPITPIATPQMARGGTETILLVDDESVIIELGREVLEQFGYRVITAMDGQEAIQVFIENLAEIDLVIMDLCLPRISGEEAVALMLVEQPDMPVILSSGMPDPANERRTINLGSVAFIQKPYRPSELLTAVREVLDHAKT